MSVITAQELWGHPIAPLSAKFFCEIRFTSISDSFGYSSGADYNYQIGQPNWTRDINGNYQKNIYDEFGRLTAVYGPNAVDSATGDPTCDPTISFTYIAPKFPTPPTPDLHISDLVSPAGAVTINRADTSRGCTSTTIRTATFADGMKRIIQTKKDATIDGGNGIVVSGTVVFDSLGRVVQQGQPVLAIAALDVYKDRNIERPTVFTYDTLDRTTSVTTPDGALTTTEYGFDIPPQGGGTMFKTTVIDPNNYVTIRGTGRGVKISYKDVHDRIAVVERTPKTALR